MSVESGGVTGPPRWRRAVVVAMWVGLAGIGTTTRPFTAAATALVLIPVGVLLVLVLRRPAVPNRPTSRLRRGIYVWSGLLAAVLAWEAFAYVRQPDWTQPSAEHPTLSTLLDPVLQQGPLRFAGWLAWLWVGWRLARR
ncbi:hypothetical protein NDR87_01420 [Nocardia sp. CDC159]|uniref:Uncharacterized protein n=1 Tax=Nocardia pulmonis TaxID=2951408 RepID=A0A9X2IW03_9NOCA|nr:MULTISPECIES: hypothetical protein [Nocardia]MCM6772330.1 hypothetical protein [Nocardia pulmonis]MCM6785012.1 hypothetical protein [Nocardia sp. CDC159]